MKTKLVSKILCLFCCSIFFAAAIAAQEKPQAIHIGEYQTADNDSAKFEALAEQVILRLQSEPATTRGFIGVQERSDLGKKVKSILSKYPKLTNEIIYLNPEYSARPVSYVEFWLVPQGADSPHPIICGLCVCPTLRVSGLRPFYNQTEYPTFTANVSGGSEEDIKYAWKISAGEIVSGQGTPTIKVDLTGVTEITATVEISGVCDECVREASLTIKIQQ